jgi:hypothetical protein
MCYGAYGCQRAGQKTPVFVRFSTVAAVHQWPHDVHGRREDGVGVDPFQEGVSVVFQTWI